MISCSGNLQEELQKIFDLLELAYDLRKQGFFAWVSEDEDGTVVLNVKKGKEKCWRRLNWIKKEKV